MSRQPFPKEIQMQMMKPLAYESTLNQEQQQEVMDVITAAVDKHSPTVGPYYESIAKQIKDALDKQCGSPWHCVLGQDFSYSVSAQGDLACLCFKC